jgi:P27 family predicted phage terminase small subunit
MRVLEDNPGKRPINKDEPKPPTTIPDPPEEVTGAALDEWHRITPLLAAMGLLSRLDRAALVGYCIAWGRWMEAEAELEKYGAVVKSPNGFPVQSPFLAIANRAMKQVKEFLVEFGMSPSARTRVSVTGASDDDDDFFSGPKPVK